MNIKDGKERNGIYCFVKELLLFADFINSKMPSVENSLFAIFDSIKANRIPDLFSLTFCLTAAGN